MMKMLKLPVVAIALLGCLNCRTVPGAVAFDSPQALDLVAEEAMDHTMGDGSWWCLFPPYNRSPYPNFHDAVFAKLRGKYSAVYRSGSEILDSQKTVRNGEVVGYRNGFEFTAAPEVIGRNRIKINYSTWYGNVGGSWQSVVYEWTGSAWKVVEIGDMIMS